MLIMRKPGSFEAVKVLSSSIIILMADIPLNDRGIQHAQMVGKALREINITHIYHSPQLRAVQALSR